MKKKKYKTGGPLIMPLTTPIPPRESLTIKPIAIKNFNEAKGDNIDMRLMEFENEALSGKLPYNRLAVTENYSPKSKSKIKKVYEKSLGGQLLQAGVSFIPGVGQILAPLVGIADQQIEQNKLAQDQAKLAAQQLQIKPNNNPYGNYAKGGVLNDNFKQYNTGSHASGNDLTVDAEGSPNPNGSNTVQNKETSFRVDNKQYVFSDVLKVKGQAFSKVAADINKKYSKARTDLDQRNALDLEMKQLSKLNDAERKNSESQQLAYGGPILGNVLQKAWDGWNSQSQVGALTQNGVPLAQGNMLVNPENSQQYGDPREVLGPQNTQVTGQAPPLAKLPTLSPEQVAGRDAEGSYKFGEEVSPLVAKTGDRSNNVLDPSTANGIALGMKGLALAGSIHDAMQKPEKEKLILPNYNKADTYIKSANVDYTNAKQDAIGVSNIGGNMNRSLSGNAAQYQGREQARLAQLQDALGRVSEAENNATSQLNMNKGQYEAGKAVDTANRQYQNQQGNMQNDANSRFFGRQLASDLSQIGSSFNEYAESTKLNKNTADIAKFTNSQIMATINAKNPNFKLDENLVQNFIDGKTSIDDVLRFIDPEFKQSSTKILKEAKEKANGK